MTTLRHNDNGAPEVPRHHDMSRIMMALFLLATGLLTGCSDDSPTATGEQRDEEMRFDVKSDRMMTRATVIGSNTELQTASSAGDDIDIFAIFHETKKYFFSDYVPLHYATDHWEFVDGSGNTAHYYWPIDGSVYKPLPVQNVPYASLDFMGIWPKTGAGYTIGRSFYQSEGQITGIELVFSGLPVTSAGQADIKECMCAYLPGQTYADQVAAGGALPLQFKHPFALIKFVIAAGSGTHVQVNSISIADVKTDGTCIYDGTTMTWSGQSGSETMMITPDTPLKYGTSSTETTPLIVIPNNYGSKTLTVNGTWDDWSNVTNDISTSVDFDWQPGYIYTYHLTVTKYALTVDDEKFTEQW